MNKQPVDPKTTRRHVRYEAFRDNSALYAQFRVIGYVTDPMTERPVQVIVQKKDEFCRH